MTQPAATIEFKAWRKALHQIEQEERGLISQGLPIDTSKTDGWKKLLATTLNRHFSAQVLYIPNNEHWLGRVSFDDDPVVEIHEPLRQLSVPKPPKQGGNSFEVEAPHRTTSSSGPTLDTAKEELEQLPAASSTTRMGWREKILRWFFRGH